MFSWLTDRVRILLLQALSLVAAVGVAIGVFAQHDPMPQLFHGQDGFEHFAAYTLLSMLVLAPPGERWARAGGLIQSTLWIECLQAVFVHTRSPSWTDAAFGSLGVAAGLAMAVALWQVVGRRREQIAEMRGVISK